MPKTLIDFINASTFPSLCLQFIKPVYDDVIYGKKSEVKNKF